MRPYAGRAWRAARRPGMRGSRHASAVGTQVPCAVALTDTPHRFREHLDFQSLQRAVRLRHRRGADEGSWLDRGDIDRLDPGHACRLGQPYRALMPSRTTMAASLEHLNDRHYHHHTAHDPDRFTHPATPALIGRFRPEPMRCSVQCSPPVSQRNLAPIMASPGSSGCTTRTISRFCKPHSPVSRRFRTRVQSCAPQPYAVRHKARRPDAVM